MNEKSVKITDFKPKERNPFIADLVEDGAQSVKRYVFGKSDRTQLVLNPDSGEIEGHAVFMKTKKVDPERFTKVYINSLQSFFEMGTKEIRVFGYIMTILRPNYDTIYFDVADCKEFTGYSSHATIAKALAVLLDLSFIARSKKKHWYFINPSIFFNGDRISFITQFQKTNKISLPDGETKKEIGDR